VKDDSAGESACDRCRALLAEYAADTLSAADRGEVQRHLASCPACAHEFAEWRALAAALRAEGDAAAPSLPFEASWAQLSGRIAHPLPSRDTNVAPHAAHVSTVAAIERAPARGAADVVSGRTERARAAFVVRTARHMVRVVAGQVALLRPAVWIASALGVALAVLYALTLPRIVGEQDVFAFALPLIAATGIAFLYGPDVDAGLEMALATPTSPRLVLLGRFALLFSYDTALALAGTLALALLHHEGFAALASVWFGPMALLSTLSLALSLVLGPAVAVGAAAVLWLSRMLTFGDGLAVHISAAAFWQTSPQILALSLVLLALSLLYVPRLERLRPDLDG
jgi:Putative zinc-finger